MDSETTKTGHQAGGKRMVQDPRRKNIVLGAEGSDALLGDYADALAQGLKSVDGAALKRAIDLVVQCAQDGGTVYFAGNGGSASICDHLVCDFVKGTYHDRHPPVNACSMTDNVALYSAIANDFGFEGVFEFQVKTRLKAQDVLIAVSSSGNSMNIIKAVRAARAKGIPTIGLSGFSGGKLAEEAEVSMVVPVQNYGVVEDAHSALLHMMVQSIGNQRDYG